MRSQEGPGGARRCQEGPGGGRRPQEAPGGPAPGGPRRLQEAPGAGETHEVPGGPRRSRVRHQDKAVSLGPISVIRAAREEPGASRLLFWRSSGKSKFLAPPGSSWSFGASWLLLASPGSSFGAPLFRHFLITF